MVEEEKMNSMNSMGEVLFEGDGYFQISKKIYIVGAKTMGKAFTTIEKYKEGKEKCAKCGIVFDPAIEKIKRGELDLAEKKAIQRGYRLKKEAKEKRLAEEAVAKGGEITVKKTTYGGGALTETTYTPTKDVRLSEVKTQDLLDELIRRTTEDEPA